MSYPKSQVFAKEDKSHNIIYMCIFYDENDRKLGATIHLKLCSERRSRLIGDYYFAESRICLKRDSAKHLFKKNNSYGFNWEIINDEFLGVRIIDLTVDGERFVFPKSIIELHGQFMNFKQEGFELQKFVPFKIIQNYQHDPEQ